MNRLSVLKGAVVVKLIYQQGGNYFTDGILGGLIGGLAVTANYTLVGLMILLRFCAGIIAVLIRVPQMENELSIQWLNPYLDGKLNGNVRRTAGSDADSAAKLAKRSHRSRRSTVNHAVRQKERKNRGNSA